MIHVKSVYVIVGSTRPRRICPEVARWVAEVGAGLGDWRLELVDLKDWPLPMDDEEDVPARGAGYAKAHTRAWSAKVAAADGLVFVSPQYNWGYPAPLKNALDHLYAEWSGKPALIVTYGGHGGDRCAAQLRQVLEGLRMRPVETMPAFQLARSRIEANEGVLEPAIEFVHGVDALRTAFAELAVALG
jgi:NAD(P)H-dependent FMN reductase